MAGWLEWNSIPFATDNSMAQTVLETVWPSVARTAVAQRWTGNWAVGMQAQLVGNIITYKKQEYPTLKDHDETVDAVVAGELFAAQCFHDKVARFATEISGQAWFLKWAKVVTPNMAHVQREGEVGAENWPRLIRALYVNNAWDFEGLTWEQYLFIYYLKVKNAGVQAATTVNTALAHYVCGLAHMGNATNAWITSRQRAIRTDMNDPDLELSRATLTRVWEFYGMAYRPEVHNWKPLFKSILDRCEEKKLLRLKITCEQSAEQGFAVVKFIRDAMTICSDFNWNRFETPRLPAERKIAAELDTWKTEMDKMVQNPFLRFTGATGITQKIPNLGTLAKELLTRAAGVQAVDGYAGLNAGNITVQYAAWINRTVSKYITEVRERDDAAAEDVKATRAPEAAKAAFEDKAKDTNPTLEVHAQAQRLPVSNALRTDVNG